ncbi:MAG: ATP synthase F1 subunit delta [Desulfobacterales bacterium]|nr:ATP synthase F1 subunit delta [Desulfobacterales bacterium]
MKQITISRRYAKALLLIGKDDGRAQVYGEELCKILELISKEKELQEAICNPLYDTASRKRVLQAVLSKLELFPVVNSFLLLLFDKGRFGLLNQINDFYELFLDEFNGVVRADLTSAFKLQPETVTRVKRELNRITGREVKLELSVDPALIGGIVTKIGDHILDGSIKTQLNNMKESLNRGDVL